MDETNNFMNEKEEDEYFKEFFNLSTGYTEQDLQILKFIRSKRN